VYCSLRILVLISFALVLLSTCLADERAAVLAAERAEAMAGEAFAVRNRLPVGHAAEDAARSRARVRSRALPLQHDQRHIFLAN
jgi:hypothetical protein